MSSQTNKLAELAAPQRGRVKYAPLTAGLLARKGEAVPATPYYAAEALDLHTAGPIVVARHEPANRNALSAAAQHSHDAGAESLQQRVRAVQMQTWRMRRPVPQPEPVDDSENHAKAEVKPSVDHTREVPKPEVASSSEVGHIRRMALSLEFDLDLIARLALHAQHASKSPTQLLEEALKEHLGHTAEFCPTCARSLGEHNS